MKPSTRLSARCVILLASACGGVDSRDSAAFSGGGSAPPDSAGATSDDAQGEAESSAASGDGAESGGTSSDGTASSSAGAGEEGPKFDLASGDPSGGGGGGGGNCGTLTATIRDFHSSHPDFGGNFFGAPEGGLKGIVESMLGADDNPAYAAAGGTVETTGPVEFAQWYNDTPNVNIPIAVELMLTETLPGTVEYENSEFFPVDNQGFGNESQFPPHNFDFTTEIHASFTYEGGEVFTFEGDDDLWIFVNRRLALDLGGLHTALAGTIDFDAQAANLEITPGNTYQMEIFHAERAPSESNFKITTTIACFTPPG